jgi:hypothetical protein
VESGGAEWRAAVRGKLSSLGSLNGVALRGGVRRRVAQRRKVARRGAMRCGEMRRGEITGVAWVTM